MNLLYSKNISLNKNISNYYMEIYKKLPDFFYILFPIISGYITIYFCPMTNKKTKKLNFRPPNYIFAIVWPILYLLLGFAWLKSKEFTVWYLILSLTLCLWLIVYSCKNNKYLALAIILISIALVLLCYTISKQISKLLLIPLLVWLCFASILSIFDLY